MSLPQTPSDYIELVRFRWPWVLAALVVGALGSQVALRFVPKQYMSQTVVLVESDKIPKSFIPRLTTDQGRDRFRTLAEEILASPRIEKILEDLNPYPEMVDVPRADIVDMIRSRTVIGLRGNDAFVLQYKDTDPERAQRMVTKLASMFIEATTGNRAQQVRDAGDFIESQLEETRIGLEKVEGELKQTKQRYMGMLPNQLEANLSTLQRLELERQSVAEQIRVAKERREPSRTPARDAIPDDGARGTAHSHGSDPSGRFGIAECWFTSRAQGLPRPVADSLYRRASGGRSDPETNRTTGSRAPPAAEVEAPSRGRNASGTEASATPATSTDFSSPISTAQVAAVDRDIAKPRGTLRADQQPDRRLPEPRREDPRGRAEAPIPRAGL